MANEFSKEEKVAFDQVMESFEDALVMSKNVSTYRPDAQTMERTNDIIWRPQPYIAQSFDGTDATNNFYDSTQLSVPATIGYHKHVPMQMSVNELRDALQEGRLGEAAYQKLSSDINVAVSNVAALQGTLFVKRGAAAGYSDVAAIEQIMNEQGINSFNRYLALSTRDYNSMADNLAKSYMSDKAKVAYMKSYVGPIASFETYKLDYATTIAAAAGGAGLTVSTLDAGANYYTPLATRTATTGETSNVDNRYQTITISSTTSVVAGDAFTIAGVNAVHHITKGDTGSLKTFRVISVPSSTTLVISPPMITAQGGTSSEKQYQNCIVNTKASNSAIVFLNTVAAPANPFWHKDAIEIIPGTYPVPTNAGVATMFSTTANGQQLVMQKWLDGNTGKIKLRFDTRFGVVMKQPEMAGIMELSQT